MLDSNFVGKIHRYTFKKKSGQVSFHTNIPWRPLYKLILPARVVTGQFFTRCRRPISGFSSRRNTEIYNGYKRGQGPDFLHGFPLYSVTR